MSDMEKRVLNDGEMEEISGGMIMDSFDTPDYDPVYRYEVINNNNGSVLGKFRYPDEAERYAKSFGPDSYNNMWVGWATVDRLRKNPNVGP